MKKFFKHFNAPIALSAVLVFLLPRFVFTFFGSPWDKADTLFGAIIVTIIIWLCAGPVHPIPIRYDKNKKMDIGWF